MKEITCLGGRSIGVNNDIMEPVVTSHQVVEQLTTKQALDFYCGQNCPLTGLFSRDCQIRKVGVETVLAQLV